MIARERPTEVTTSTEQLERRSHARIPVAIDAKVTDQNKEANSCQVANLSIGGCYIITENPLPKGTEVKLQFNGEGPSFDCCAVVVRTVPGKGMGLSFTRSSSSVVDWLSNLKKTPQVTIEFLLGPSIPGRG